jgi:hypothetical protein
VHHHGDRSLAVTALRGDLRRCLAHRRHSEGIHRTVGV